MPQHDPDARARRATSAPDAVVDDVRAGGVEPAGRIARWASAASLAFVVATIAALVLAPFIAERYIRPLRGEMAALAEPGRGSVTTIQNALALQVANLHDFLDTGDSTFARRYREERERERDAHERLGPLVGHLGPRVRERYDTLRTLERRWHEAAEQTIRERASHRPGEELLTLERQLYEDLLVATSQLDETLEAAIRLRQQRIERAEQVERRVASLLGVIGLAALGGVAWLAARLRVYARAAEEGRRALEQVMESKARLMRGLSHDLKNPLNAIDGHAALLEEGVGGPLSEAQRASVGRIRRGVRSLLALISDLLELSRAEVGELRVERKATDFAALLRDVVEEHRAEAGRARHSLSLELPRDLPVVATDPDRVRQVVGNLLSNAIKYTPEGGVIAVQAELRPAPGRRPVERQVAVDVTDTGPGIPRDKAEEVFNEFTRLEGTGRPGAGLGLAIARRIARLLGGDVTLSSEPGRGSRFTLWLPAEDPSDAGRLHPPASGGHPAESREARAEHAPRSRV